MSAVLQFVSPRALSILDSMKKLSCAEFEDACELRFREKGGVSVASARHFAKTAVSEILAARGIAYGSPGFLWTPEETRDLADAEMKIWTECDR